MLYFAFETDSFISIIYRHINLKLKNTAHPRGYAVFLVRETGLGLARPTRSVFRGSQCSTGALIHYRSPSSPLILSNKKTLYTQWVYSVFGAGDGT